MKRLSNDGHAESPEAVCISRPLNLSVYVSMHACTIAEHFKQFTDIQKYYQLLFLNEID